MSSWLTQLQKAVDHDPFFGVRAAAIFVVVVGAFILGRWLQHIASRFPAYVATRSANQAGKWSVLESRTGLSRWLGRLAFVCVLIAAAELVAAIVGIGSLDTLVQGGQKTLRAVVLVAPQLVSSLVLIAIILAAGRLLQRGTVIALNRARADRSLQILGGRSAYVAVLILGAIVVLSVWGVPLAVPVTLFGVLTLALSLALQDVLRNIFAGVYLLLERPFVIGDEISVTTFSGRVEDIQLRVTSLRARDGERVLLPNALLFTSPVVNASANRRRRAIVAVSLPASKADDLAHAESMIISALARVTGIQPDPAPSVILSGAAQGKLELRVVFWVPAHPAEAGETVISSAVDGIRTVVTEADVSVAEPAAS